MHDLQAARFCMIQENNEPRRVFLKMGGGEVKLMRDSEKGDVVWEN
jgi:hypothetical protein